MQSISGSLGINKSHPRPELPHGNAEVEQHSQLLNRAFTTAKLDGKV